MKGAHRWTPKEEALLEDFEAVVATITRTPNRLRASCDCGRDTRRGDN